MPDNKFKGLLPVIIVALLAAVLIFPLLKSSGNERKLRILKETELASKITEVAKKDAQIADLVKQKEALEFDAKSRAAASESAVKDYEAKIKSLSDNLDALSKDNESLSKEREDFQKQIEDLSAKIRALEAEKAGLTLKITELQAAKAVVPAAEKDEEGSFEAESESAPEEAAEPVELGRIIVQKASGSAAQVQHVDKVYGFVLINAGSKDDLRKDTIITISRKKKLIARAVIEKVKESVSAAVLLPEWTQGDVRAGDTVTAA